MNIVHPYITPNQQKLLKKVITRGFTHAYISIDEMFIVKR